eukprot:TRINITY_DN13700_c0_g1_i1.p1 TRINITY_DN13700_c0_g1~~TRINITY_DN13700_c0_g1_i1.p1  ORF type:complete len:139 (+),score=18.62 TRINITY_DN13700_c0_g1_i1:122-538(+)
MNFEFHHGRSHVHHVNLVQLLVQPSVLVSSCRSTVPGCATGVFPACTVIFDTMCISADQIIYQIDSGTGCFVQDGKNVRLRGSGFIRIEVYPPHAQSLYVPVGPVFFLLATRTAYQSIKAGNPAGVPAGFPQASTMLV